MKSSRNIAVSIVVVIAIARVMFGSMALYRAVIRLLRLLFRISFLTVKDLLGN